MSCVSATPNEAASHARACSSNVLAVEDAQGLLQRLDLLLP
eukprot:CAMPEP_0176042370 /NCGR_PEP_ID=MMETSP0120_2-20121206/21022_1 /TAXON_ID=160619 /ORGANISM="Kryptoperidinium foliaceum, Strain CCMP 1326" /LENGTH=40 /DNA_ID= /DNA_START= /DNA_END= /DNA_ORIENTATION=